MGGWVGGWWCVGVCKGSEVLGRCASVWVDRNMCVYVCVCACVYVRANTHTYIDVYKCICAHIKICVFVHESVGCSMCVGSVGC